MSGEQNTNAAPAARPEETPVLDAMLEQLFDDTRITLAQARREVEIKKVTLRTMKPIATFIATLFADLQLTADNLPTVDLQNPALILKSISKYYDEIVAIVVSLTDLEPDDLLDMEADESVLVIQAVVALNQDFFTKKVLPNLRGMVGDDLVSADG